MADAPNPDKPNPDRGELETTTVNTYGKRLGDNVAKGSRAADQLVKKKTKKKLNDAVTGAMTKAGW